MKKLLSLFAVILLTATGLMAQEPQPLPMEENIRYGVLENGLTYYIRYNNQPKERCEFHIAQAVGAILEEDHQNGLAHFLEHMAFNGTTNFPDKLLINYFESVGVGFGSNINAYTSLDETVYRLSNVPTREEILDSALLTLHDWSCAIALQEAEIDNERGVIREEWRTGNTAQRRMWREGNKLKYPGSQYAKRDVIGDTAVINNFTYQALRDYYELWYGPDLQCIVVVGDIDVDKMEQKIKDLFSKIPARSNRGERPRYSLPTYEGTHVAIYTDKEAQFTQLAIEFLHPTMPRELRATDQGYLLNTINNIIRMMISYRIEEITMDPNANFIQAMGGYGNQMGETDAFEFIVIPKDGKEKASMADMFTQVEKIKRYGFTNAELERAKTEYLATVERYYNERTTRQSQSYAEEYYRNYLDGEAIPGIEFEYEYMKAVLPQLPVAIINQLAQQYITDNNIIISYIGKENSDIVSVPTQEEVLEIFNAVKASEIEAPVEETFDRPLVETAPQAGTIVKEKFNKKLGTTEWTLSNGIKVVIKPTEFKNDQIIMSMESEGGLSKVALEDLPSAAMADGVISYNGIGEFSVLDLQKILTGKNVSISPSIGEYSESMSGSSTVKDFETMMQLAYLYFTAPRQDDQAYQTLMSMLETQLAARDKNPKTAFQDSIQQTTTCHSPRTLIVNLDLIKRANQQRAIEIYKERFANPADFFVTFIGNINPADEATRQIICTWLGGLKTDKSRETYTDHGVRYPQGKVNNYFAKEMETKTASNRIVYSGKMKATLANRLNMGIIGDILGTRYLESIREKEGGSYGVGCAGYVMQDPIEQAVLLMQFDTDPEKQQKLMSIIHKEVMEIIENGPRADDLQKAKENRLNTLAEDMETNGWWGTILDRYYQDGIDYVKDYKKTLEKVNAKSIQKTLKALVKQGNVVEVVMMPAE
ncbi:MAG: insulinase family protein [Paludibacteraceae bacterium]|nr:insulinase family protein [Paludibacteraceae bacterium]